MTAVELRHGAATDVGRLRPTNQDACLDAPPVFVVADDMGGHDQGEVASAIVVEEFARLAGATYDAAAGAEALARTFVTCQQRILAYDAARREAGEPDFSTGTTAVVALLVEEPDGPGSWLVANVGDSRAYRWHRGELVQVSVDHSLVQELVDAGVIDVEEAGDHPARHVVTRALGGDGLPEPDFFRLPLATARRLLLCSDGVNGMLADAEITAVLGAGDDASQTAGRLVAEAVAAGGHDNATAVVVDVVGWADDNPQGPDAPGVRQG